MAPWQELSCASWTIGDGKNALAIALDYLATQRVSGFRRYAVLTAVRLDRVLHHATVVQLMWLPHSRMDASAHPPLNKFARLGVSDSRGLANELNRLAEVGPAWARAAGRAASG